MLSLSYPNYEHLSTLTDSIEVSWYD